MLSVHVHPCQHCGSNPDRGPFRTWFATSPPKKKHILNLRPAGPVGCRDVSKTDWKSASFFLREPSLEAMAVHLTRGASDIFASVIF